MESLYRYISFKFREGAYMKKDEIRKKLNDILNSQPFAVIATQDEKGSYTNLVAFANPNDLKNIIFATSKKTKKYENIKKNSHMSMLIDNRKNDPSDIKNATAVTVLGSAIEVVKNKGFFTQLYIKKHPYLSDFVKSPDCKLICLNVDKYVVVNSFEKVVTINV